MKTLLFAFFAVSLQALDYGREYQSGDITVTPIKVQPNLILPGISDHEAIAVVIRSRGNGGTTYTVTIRYGGTSATASAKSVSKEDGRSSAVAWFDVKAAPRTIDKITVKSSGEETFE